MAWLPNYKVACICCQAWQYLLTASYMKILHETWCSTVPTPDTSGYPQGTRGVGLFFSKDPMFTSCLIFFSKGCPFSWNSATIPDSSDSCLITSWRSSTRWDGVWGWRKDWVHLHQRKFSICINKPTNPRNLLELTSIFRGPYLISWAVSACLNGVGVLGELSRIDLLIAGVLKL